MTELPIPERVNREANPVIASLLQEAKGYLWDGRWGFRESGVQICDALQCVHSWEVHVQYEEALKAIGRALRPYATYYSWLMHHHPEAADAAHPTLIQAGRLRWMNQLIEEFGGRT